jgi:hypothetical protein
MTGGNLIPMALLRRKAVVYVRQSTTQQVNVNLESQRRQYELVDLARRWGFRDVEVIDEDLGRSASGAVSSVWWRICARVASAPYCVWRPLAFLATDPTGIGFSSFAVRSMPG